MGRIMQKSFPEFLSEILRPSPSGTEKLLAAWDGLSVEYQIKILLDLDGLNHQAICRNALNSRNAYVRYLAAKQFSFSPMTLLAVSAIMGIYRSERNRRIARLAA